MVRKNPYAEEILDRYVSNAVGTGLRPRSLHPEDSRRQVIHEAWNRWVDEADADGVTNFYGLQAMAVRSMIEGGDCFACLRARLPEDGLSVPLQVQLLEAEMVPLRKTERLPSGRRIRTGIEFDALGRRTAYHMYAEHPGDLMLGVISTAGTTSPVPAATVAHVYRPLRPGQVRGVTGLATVLLRLHELDQFDDAAVVKQKIAAALSGFITSPLDEHGGDGDLSDVNYSSIRAGLLEFRREVEQFQQCFFVFQFCRPIWRRFIRDVIVAGTIDAPDFRRNPNAYFDCRWVPQGFKWVDPLKEVAALVKAIRAGLISRTEAVQMSGYDPEVIDGQVAADNARADALGLGLGFDSDGRRAERSGRQGAPRDEDDTLDDDERRSTGVAHGARFART